MLFKRGHYTLVSSLAHFRYRSHCRCIVHLPFRHHHNFPFQPVEQRRLPLFRPLPHQDLDGHAQHATLDGATHHQRSAIDGEFITILAPNSNWIAILGGKLKLVHPSEYGVEGGDSSAALDGELHETDGGERQEAVVDSGLRSGSGRRWDEGIAGSDEA